MSVRRIPSRPLVFAALVAGLATAASAPAAPRGPEPSSDIPARTTHAAKAGPSEIDVGDADSFGRNLRWLGVADAQVQLDADCSGVDPTVGCQVLAPAPASTAFAFEDLGRIVLPEKASTTILCHWWSPVLDLGYANPTAAPVVAHFDYAPTLTIENPVLATPGLIDASTGLPFGGRLTTGMTASERFSVPLPPGTAFDERQRDSAVCIAGFLTRKSLVEFHGLSAAQAKEFFRQPTTVRINVRGNAQFVSYASLYFGFRILGD